MTSNIKSKFRLEDPLSGIANSLGALQNGESLPDGPKRAPRDAFEALTGKQRNYQYDTEHENQACIQPGQGHGGIANRGDKNWGKNFQKKMNDMLISDTMEMAARNIAKEGKKSANNSGGGAYGGQKNKQKRKGGGKSEDEDSDDENSDNPKSDVEEDRFDGQNAEDEDLEQIRERRMAKMREEYEKKQEYKAKGHGEYHEIKENEFLDTVTKSHRAIVHFYHQDFESCKVADLHLRKIAKKCLSVKIVKMEAENSPFFVTKLSIQTIPSMCMFIDGVLVGKQLGFHGLEGGPKNEIKTGHLARVFKDHGVIEEEIDSDDEF